jgi:hypothetical protein
VRQTFLATETVSFKHRNLWQPSCRHRRNSRSPIWGWPCRTDANQAPTIIDAFVLLFIAFVASSLALAHEYAGSVQTCGSHSTSKHLRQSLEMRPLRGSRVGMMS